MFPDKSAAKRIKQGFSSCNGEHRSETSEYIEQVMNVRRGELIHVVHYAHMIKEEIERVSGFIQQNTSVVCPSCEKVCCINKHGYYDHQDLIYVFALGLERPVYGEGIHDTAPCQFLSGLGCRKERSARPFRCNWYFCDVLLAYMEHGPAKPYREFITRFQEVIETRRKMIDEFSVITRFQVD